MIILKSSREIDKMRRAGAVVGTILKELQSYVKPAMTTLDIDYMAEKMIKKFQVKSAFKGYKGYRHCICTSVNEEVVHGVPSKDKVLKEGDILSMDFGVVYDGYYGDSALTMSIGDIPMETRKLLQVTEESLYKGIEQIKVNNHVHDISYAVQSHVEKHGFSVVREFVGHGIGQALHEDPPVPNYGEPHTGAVLKVGMVLAVEPMVNMGKAGVQILDDGWTATTVDNSLSAHYEHTIAILSDGPEILTHIGD